MTAINHAMTGAVIGLSVQQPWLALPLALVSHYALDALPHYGKPSLGKHGLRVPSFSRYLLLEALMCLLLVTLVFAAQPNHWLLAVGCAFAAAAPDFLWLNRYIKARSGKSWRPGAHSRFADWIQWYEKPSGGIFEALWAGTMVLLLAKLV